VSAALDLASERPAESSRPQWVMADTLPPLLRHWVARQASRMGLPGPDDYIVLLIRLEKQRQALAAFAKFAQINRLPADPTPPARQPARAGGEVA
jgi:hypothetical protein